MSDKPKQGLFSGAKTGNRIFGPFEIVAIFALNTFVFGWLMGQGHFEYTFEMMIPGVALCALVLIAQGLFLRRDPDE